MTTEREMIQLLRRRYGTKSANGLPKYVTAPQVPIDGNHYVDFVAVSSHREQIFQEDVGKYKWFDAPVHGFEIKVSRSDWLREYKTNGVKSYPWRSRCNYWWLVVPVEGIVLPGELPSGWGLLVGEKRLRAAVQADRCEAENEFSVDLMREVSRFALRDITRQNV